MARRRLLNEEEIFERLKPYGFELIIPSTLSVAEQIAVFSQAEIVVGAHGSGFSNMMFASPQAKMIEIQSPGWSLGFFRVLAWLMGQQHRQILGSVQGSGNPKAQDYVADSRHVESLIKEELAENKH